MRGLRLGLGLNGGIGLPITPVLSAFGAGSIDDLELDPPAIFIEHNTSGTLTGDFDASATPPAKEAGDIGFFTTSLSGEAVTDISTALNTFLDLHPGETGYLHFRLTNGAGDSSVITTQVITVPAAVSIADYAANSINPVMVADFPNAFYATAGAEDTFSGMFTFARASIATFVSSTGLVQSASSGAARTSHYAWNGSAYVNKGLLLESEARTNLNLHSEDLTNASGWNSPENATVTANQIDAPDGNLTADLFAETTANSFHRIHPFPFSVTTGTRYAQSVFVKTYGTRRYVYFRNGVTGSNRNVGFDLVDEAVDYLGGAEVASIERLADGWYRISATWVSSLTNAAVPFYVGTATSAVTSDTIPSFTGSTSEGLYIWGGQFEAVSQAAPHASSYIPTTGSAVTRLAETLFVPAVDAPDYTTATSLRLRAEINYADAGAAAQIVLLDWRADGNNFITYDIDTDSTATGEVNFNQAASGTVDTVASAGGALSPGRAVVVSIAGRHTDAAINGAVGGTALTEDATPTAIADLSAANLAIGTTAFMGTIQQLVGWGADIGDVGIAEDT